MKCSSYQENEVGEVATEMDVTTTVVSTDAEVIFYSL